ncbi:MAG: patatin-like phospholipase family protein [Candidatus Thiodiazotropha sp. (ex Ctena orbiculata)]|nr:patatin-like phospholipase family protein [Candidatus Thiodiazotropha taylori]
MRLPNCQSDFNKVPWLALILLLISGCSSVQRQFPAPAEHHYESAQVSGYKNIRFWGDKPAPYLDEAIESLRISIEKNPEWKQRFDLLALSGGAEDGAYGAGFLKGWSERGDRPEFFMVTGISTGALIAPFAFLGPAYDDAIKRLFTQSSKQDIFFLTPFSALFGGSALGDTKPLQKIIREEVDDDLVEAIARESRKGRILQIATTNIDAQRPVIWEIGRIAASGHPGAKQLIQTIMLASASIPGVFPPVFLDIEIDGERFQEVHVDGGVTSQIFVYPRGLQVRDIEKQLDLHPKKSFWLIRNTKIDAEYAPVGLGVGDITSRSISTLIKYQGRGNLLNISSLAERDGFDVHITNVPADFDEPLNDFFDPVYMQRLYEVGYSKALSDCPWHVTLNEECNVREDRLSSF